MTQAKKKAAPKKAPEILDDIAKSSGTSSSGRKRKAMRRLFLFLVIVVPLFAITGYVGYQQWLLQDRLSRGDTDNTTLTNTLAEQSATIAELQQQLESLNQRINESATVDDSELQASEQNLRREITRLDRQLAEEEQALQELQAQITGGAKPDLSWKLREADLLVSIAGRKLQLDGDVSTAIALLTAADAALVSSTNPNIFQAREALAADLTSLREITQPNRNDLYLRLGELLQDLEQIDILNSMRQNYEQRRTTETPAENGLIAGSLNFLSSVFVWRERENATAVASQSTLAPDQEMLIKQQLRLMLEQARLALYSRDNALYRSSLTNILTELQRYTTADEQAKQATIAELNELINIDVNPTLPNLTRSATRIAQLIAAEN
ncbi:MAG: uroporphyrinogen-III C-methyltransferase [Pseudohongiellaceae bacterium]